MERRRCSHSTVDKRKTVVADRDKAAGERLKAKLLLHKSWEKPRARRLNQRLAGKEEFVVGFLAKNVDRVIARVIAVGYLEVHACGWPAGGRALAAPLQACGPVYQKTWSTRRHPDCLSESLGLGAVVVLVRALPTAL